MGGSTRKILSLITENSRTGKLQMLAAGRCGKMEKRKREMTFNCEWEKASVCSNTGQQAGAWQEGGRCRGVRELRAPVKACLGF